MTTFWSAWVIILTTITMVLIAWVLWANRKTEARPDHTETTGHIYDGIEELDNPLPSWWFYMFVATMVFGVLYLIAYPGMGNFKGVLGWTSTGQWQEEVDEANARYGPIFEEFLNKPVAELVNDPKANKMGQRIFANNCAQCHGSDAGGSYGFPNLTDDDWLFGSSAETIKATLVGGRQGAMPGWQAALGDEGIRNVAHYVRGLNGELEVDKEAAAAGANQYQMFCAACHGTDGKGNQSLGAPNLTDNIWLYGGSQTLVEHTLRVGRNGRMPAFGDMLSESKIHLLTAYVQSLSTK